MFALIAMPSLFVALVTFATRSLEFVVQPTAQVTLLSVLHTLNAKQVLVKVFNALQELNALLQITAMQPNIVPPVQLPLIAQLAMTADKRLENAMLIVYQTVTVNSTNYAIQLVNAIHLTVSTLQLALTLLLVSKVFVHYAPMMLIAILQLIVPRQPLLPKTLRQEHATQRSVGLPVV
jgi:hypothetical protein